MGKTMIVYNNAPTVNEWSTDFKFLFQALYCVIIIFCCVYNDLIQLHDKTAQAISSCIEILLGFGQC